MPENIIQEAKDRKTSAQDCWSSIFQAGRDDLKFLSDDPAAQWDDRDYERRKRKNRPVLTIDQLTQFVNQVSNDIRMNTPTINIIPHSGGADLLTAEVFQGLIRDIEQTSNADSAYDHAVNCAIRSSIGFIRVDHRVKDRETGMQELFVQRVVNQFSIYLDPDSTEPDGSDAEWCIVLDEISKEAFESKYPDFSPISFDSDSGKDDYLIIAEYFKIQDIEGQRVVLRYLLSGQDVLDETTFPGEYIPIIPVYGEEAWVDGTRHLHSLVRKAKDPQRRYNYLASMEAELLMKAPKATIIAVGGTTEAYASDYKNPDDAIVLRYDQTDAKGNPAPPPQMNPGPQIPAGIVNAMQMAAQDIKSTMGLYNAFIGQSGNEKSGVAIQQRKMEGDRAVYHFGDNLVRSIGQVGRVLVCAIPFVYVEPRIERVVGMEEESELVGINGALAEGQEQSIFLNNGKYSVRVTTGASFATMREEAAEFFQQVIQSQPQLIEVAGDLLFKYMDFPGAQALAERMKRLIPPNLLDEQQDPQVAALSQENEQLKAAIAQMQQELQSKQADLQVKVNSDQLKAQSEQAKNEIEVLKLQLQERESMGDNQIKQAELQIKQKELEIKEAELQLKAQEMALNAYTAQNPPQAPVQAPVPQPPQTEQNNEVMAMALAGIAQAMNNTAAPKKIIRNNQGLIDQIV